MRKQVLIILLVLLSSGFSFAQQQYKVAVKLEKLYENRPEKCIQKCKKYISKGKHRKMAYYYLSLTQYKTYQSSDKDRDLLRTMISLRKYYKSKGNSELIHDTALLSSIKINFEELINQKIKKEQLSVARRYAKKFKQVYKEDIANADKLIVQKKAPRVSPIAPRENRVKTARLVNTGNLMKTAKSLIGVRYKIGGESRSGLDCSGFNQFVYANEGVKIPHSAAAQSKLGSLVPLKKCKAGDLVFFGSKKVKGYKIQHTGLIYANKDGQLKIIHCPNSGVCIEGDGDTSWDMYWKKRFLFIKRLDNKKL